MSARRILIALCLLAFVCGIAALADLVICPKCGWENQPRDRHCEHCGAELPEQAEDKPAAEEPEPDGRGVLKTIDRKIVDDETAEGITRMNDGDWFLARLLFRNAAALNMLAGPEGASDRSRRIMQHMRQCEEKTGMIRDRERMSGGALRAILENLGRAEKGFALLQRSKRFVPVGNAWVPGDIEKDLSIRQTVLLKKSFPMPCSECAGVGRVECGECHGTGAVKCPNPDCRDGKVKVVTKGQLSRFELVKTMPCPVCQGRGAVVCEECAGIGTVVCSKCHGSGEKALCGKCGGQGFIVCSKCNGTGKDDGETCRKCGGAGIEVCPSCSGTGRK